jgi:hypothetical protein
VDEIFGDVLSVDHAEVRPGDGPPNSSDDPGTDPVVMAQRVADPDETGRLPEELGEGGPGGESLGAAPVGRMPNLLVRNAVLRDPVERSFYNTIDGRSRERSGQIREAGNRSRGGG